MNTQSQKLLHSAMALPESERAEIATMLIRSLDPRNDEDAEVKWAEEVQRRINSIDRGEVNLIPWNDVMQELLGDSSDSPSA